jgi:uncharacterized protein YbgA (DUF1722 family)
VVDGLKKNQNNNSKRSMLETVEQYRVGEKGEAEK